MIFWTILAVTIFVGIVVGSMAEDKSIAWLPEGVGVFVLTILTLVTGTTSASDIKAWEYETTVTELGEVTYKLDPNGTVKNGYELEFIYVDSQGTSKTFSEKVDTVEFTGGSNEITIYERDYSYGDYWVPWGTGAILTEAVVR